MPHMGLNQPPAEGRPFFIGFGAGGGFVHMIWGLMMFLDRSQRSWGTDISQGSETVLGIVSWLLRPKRWSQSKVLVLYPASASNAVASDADVRQAGHDGGDFLFVRKK